MLHTLKLASVSSFGPPIVFLPFSTAVLGLRLDMVYLSINASFTGYIPRSYPLTLAQIHSTSYRCILGLDADANATHPSLLPSSTGCDPPSSSSPPRRRLASGPRIIVSLHRDTLARRTPRGSSSLLPSSLAASSILPAIYPMPSSLPPPTPPSLASVHGRDSIGSTRYLRRLQGVLLQARHVRCVRVRDGSGGRSEWRMLRLEDAVGCVDGKRTGGGVGMPDSLVSRDRGNPVVNPRARSVGRRSCTPHLPSLGRDASASTSLLQDLQSSPASYTRAALPLMGFLPVYADAARLPPQRHQPPSAARYSADNLISSLPMPPVPSSAFGGRSRKKNGMGRGAMQAPARRSGAEPRRKKLALGGRASRAGKRNGEENIQ
ncbi:hypothetical protein B0H14DRAFT_2630153 [Mycena olivaceomarginata]|nr:hypothetical protein B0H14DRAFT_2630153 [Mycena olivaceomarginata]